MPEVLQCPDHPKYKGNNVIKRLDTCEGCRKVRESYLARIQARRNQGHGDFPSITSPHFNCGLVHLFAEMCVLMVYGYQPKFFWRKGSGAPKEVQDFYQVARDIVQGFLSRNENADKGIRRFLWKTAMAARAKAVIVTMQEDHDQQQDRREEFGWIEEKAEEPIKTEVNEEALNPFLDEDLLDG